MATIAKIPLEYERQALDDLYKPTSNISTTEETISKHLELGTRGAGMAHAAAIDIDKLHSSLPQNIMDIFHQSSLSWDEFTKASDTMSNLGKHTSLMLNSFQTNFKRSIYAPLLPYLLSPQQPYLLNGDPNLLLQQLSDVYNHLKRKRMPRNCCLQICVRSQNSLQNGDLDCKPRFAAKETTYTDFTSIENKMEECIARFDDNCGCCDYKRYEILSSKEQFQIFEAKCNGTIPSCSFQHPLCKIYNTTQNILPNGELDARAPGLITVAFSKCNNCIRIDLILSDGATLYGKRIFKQDMINTVPKLFATPQLAPTIQSQLNKLQFVADGIYNKYHKHIKDNAGRCSLADRLPDFVHSVTIHHNQHDLDLLELTRCFEDNNIDDEYIRTHKVKEFRELLGLSCDISAGVATKLWRYLGGFGLDNDDQDISIPKFGSYTYYDEKEESGDDEAEYDPLEEVEFFQALLFMHNEYEEEEIQQLSKEFEEMLLLKQSKEIQQPSSCKNDNEVTVNYSDEDLSVQSDWSDEDEDGDISYGESLAIPSEWEDDDIDNHQSNYYYLDYKTVTNINLNAMVNFLFLYNDLFNYSIIRYLLLYEYFANFDSEK